MYLNRKIIYSFERQNDKTIFVENILNIDITQNK